MTPEQKHFIDTATLEQLLRRWRFAPADGSDTIFQGEAGKYYSEVMFKKRDENPAEWVGISKLLGWER